MMLLLMCLLVLACARVALCVAMHPLHIEAFMQYRPACMTTHVIERASRSYVRQVSGVSFLCDVIERKAPPRQNRAIKNNIL